MTNQGKRRIVVVVSVVVNYKVAGIKHKRSVVIWATYIPTKRHKKDTKMNA